MRVTWLAAPIHPIFVHFTIALTTSSLVFDALARVLGVPSLAAAGWWTLVGAVPATLGAVASGVVSRLRLPMEEGEARRLLRAHMALGPTFLGLLVAVALWRWKVWSGAASLSWPYLAAMAAVAAVMTVQGYLGGELVYRCGAAVEGRYGRLPSAPDRAGSC